MNTEAVEQIANAVLYEGYILYPYRASAVKNRQRFNFGTLFPRAFCEADNSNDAWRMRTECLVAGRNPTLEIRVRFLHPLSREVRRLPETSAEKLSPAMIDSPGELVESLTIGDQVFQTWQ